MVKLRDWSPYLLDKDKAEEVARILQRDEARKKLESQQLRDAEARRKQDEKRAKALGRSHDHVYIFKLKLDCHMKDDLARSYERAQTDKGRESYRSQVLHDSKWLFQKPETEKVEWEIDHKISLVKEDMENSQKACEKLKEADILVAKMELDEQAEKQRNAESRRKWEEEHKWSFVRQTAKVICVVATIGLCGFFIQW